MAYRVIQWRTGNVGRQALRGIITRPDFELVGVKVYSEDKVGHDAGQLVGLAATGVAVKINCIGSGCGRDVLDFSFVWRVTDDVRPDWGVGEFWEVRIEGDPSIHCRPQDATQFDSKRITSLTVATTALNAIPTVCEASPGVTTPLSLPCWGGGFIGPTTIADPTRT